jgi:hypothetical protein
MTALVGQRVEYQTLIFSSHAIQRMFLRRITQEEVKTVIAYGEIIDEDPDDQPFPSYLLLDFVSNRPIHVVFSYDRETDTGYVVTAYIPDPNIWKSDFRTKR